MSDAGAQKHPRPLSPHLQVYRPQLTSVLSIMHRVAGAALAIGTLMVIWMLVAAAAGPEAFGAFADFAGSNIGMLMIFGWSCAFCYHICNGVRHLIWDTVHLFEIKNAYRAGYAVLACALLLLALIWGGVFWS